MGPPAPPPTHTTAPLLTLNPNTPTFPPPPHPSSLRVYHMHARISRDAATAPYCCAATASYYDAATAPYFDAATAPYCDAATAPYCDAATAPYFDAATAPYCNVYLYRKSRAPGDAGGG